MATTKRNRGRKSARRASSHHRRTKPNTGHRRRTKYNKCMAGGLTGLFTNAAFAVAGAVATQQVTQMLLSSNNTGVMGYAGNIGVGLALSLAARMFPATRGAAPGIMTGALVLVVIRLISDYTPYGSYVKNLGMGDYLAQAWTTPQRIAYQTHSAALMPSAGMSGCNSLYSGSGLYAA